MGDSDTGCVRVCTRAGAKVQQDVYLRRYRSERGRGYGQRMNYASIVDALRAARERQELSLSQVGRRHGTSRQLVSNREAGRSRADVDQLQEWAGAVGMGLVVELVSHEDAETIGHLLKILQEGHPSTKRLVARYLRLTSEDPGVGDDGV